MAITERTPNGTSTVSLATRTNTVVTAPSGAVSGDVIVVSITSGASALRTVTAPVGWETLGRVSYSESDPWTVEVTCFAKVYSGESDWTFTHSSSSSQAFAKAYVGVDTTTIQDVAGSTVTSGGASNLVVPSITTVTDGAWLVLTRGSWDGNAITPPTGFTEHRDVPVIWVGTSERATAGSTGTVTIASGNSGGALACGAVMGALRPASASTDGEVTSVTATATAAAVASTVTGGAVLAGETATATAEALEPTAIGGATVTGVAATATALALPPVVDGGESPNGSVSAVAATATALAVPPVATGDAQTASVAATSTALAEPPTVTGETVLEGGGPATATAQAHAPVVVGGAVTVAVVATATAQAYAPTLDTNDDAEVLAVPATATAQANAPTFSVPGGVASVAAEATATAVAPVMQGDAAVTHWASTAFARGWAPTVEGVVTATVEAVCATAVGICRRPAVTVIVPTYHFECPTHEAPMWSKVRPLNYYRLTHAASVVRVGGVLTSIHQPRPDQIAAAGVEGVDWFLGGRVYNVTAEVKAELLAAGFPVS